MGICTSTQTTHHARQAEKKALPRSNTPPTSSVHETQEAEPKIINRLSNRSKYDGMPFFIKLFSRHQQIY